MFYISISNGLLKDGHRARIGSAVWEYMWFIDKVTKVDDKGMGWVLGGKPIKLEEMSKDLETHYMTISSNITKLEKAGYIKKIRTPYGLSIRVVKAKKSFGKRLSENTDSKRLSENTYSHKKNTYSNKTISIDNTTKTEKIYPQYNSSSWDIINTMYTYESLDDSGNPLKKVKKKITKEENEMLISVGFLWQTMCAEYLGLDEKEIPMKNLYYPIRATYDRTGFQKEDFKKLFKYFFLDNDIKTESKLSFDLCLSEKYVAKYKLNKKLQAKHSSGTFEVKL